MRKTYALDKINRRYLFSSAYAPTYSCVLVHALQEPEKKTHSLRWGTRDTILRGGRRFLAAVDLAEKKPVAQFDGFAFQAKALPDEWNYLGDRERVVLQDGKVAVKGKARQPELKPLGLGATLSPKRLACWSSIVFQELGPVTK